MATRKKRRRKSRRSSGASAVYTVVILGLIAAIVLILLSLYGVFAPPPSKEGELSVLVLNGCGVGGIGLRTAQFLRSEGYDVVDFRNADHFDYAETVVLDRTGDTASALGLAKLLKTGNVVEQVPETPLVDIAVIVGKDFEKFLPEE